MNRPLHGLLTNDRSRLAIGATLLAAMALPCLHLVQVSLAFEREANPAVSFSWFLGASYPLWVLLWAAVAAIWWRRPLAACEAALLAIPGLLAIAGALAPPMLSDDVYRYLWEGRVILAGFNPYSVAPDAQALAFLAERFPAIHSSINNPQLSAIYPPLAQMLFAMVAAVAMHPAAMKLALVGVGFLAWPAYHRFLRRRGIATGRVLALASHPLLVMEVAFGGHMDVLLLLGAVLVFWGVAMLEDAPRRCGLFALAGGFAITVLSKLAPVVLLPHLLRQVRGARARWASAGMVVLLVAAFYAPFAGAGTRMFSSLTTYGKKWESNGVLYPVLLGSWERIDPSGTRIDGALDGTGRLLGVDGFSDRVRRTEKFDVTESAQFAARATAALLLGVVWLAALLRVREFERQWMYVIGAGLLLSPVVHPWYLLALLPVALLGGGASTAALWWTIAIPCTYAVLPQWWTQGEWHLPAWTWWVQVGGMVAVAVWWRIVRRRHSEVLP